MDNKVRFTYLGLLCLTVIFVGPMILSVHHGPTYGQGVQRVLHWWVIWLLLLAFVVIGAPVCAGAMPVGFR